MFPYAVKVTVPSGNPAISTENLRDLLENYFTIQRLTCIPSDVNLQMENSVQVHFGNTFTTVSAVGKDG